MPGSMCLLIFARLSAAMLRGHWSAKEVNQFYGNI